VPSKSQLEQIKTEIQNKGYATNCHPDNLKFFSHQNVREYVGELNNDPNNEKYPEDFNEPYFNYATLDEPWGNCVAIYLEEENNINKALEVLSKYADNFVKKHPDTSRNW